MKTITFLYKETEQNKMDGVTCVVIILLRYLVVDDGIGAAAGGVVVSAKLFPPTWLRKQFLKHDLHLMLAAKDIN